MGFKPAKKLSILLLASFALFGQACVSPDEADFDWFACINSDQMPASTKTLNAVGSGNSHLFPSSDKLWGRRDSEGSIWPKKIRICWHESAYTSPKYAVSRATVQRAIEETWQQALDIPGIPEEQKISFYSWEKCGGPPYGEPSIRLNISDERSHASGLGIDNVFYGGLTLNFEYKKWHASCSESEAKKQSCIYATAVHEFGHLLGLAHEHNRPDTNREKCDDAPNGGDGDLIIGEWDLHSIMNYCNPDWNNDGNLSKGDVYGIQRAYYPEYFRADCGIPVTPIERAQAKQSNINRNPAVSDKKAVKILGPELSRPSHSDSQKTPASRIVK